MLFLGCKVDESRLCIVIIALASAIQSRWVMTVCLCCAVLISIVNMYFHKHCKQLSCRGYKSCFHDVLGVNSQEIKNPLLFLHWLELMHVSVDPLGVFEWYRREQEFLKH